MHRLHRVVDRGASRIAATVEGGVTAAHEALNAAAQHDGCARALRRGADYWKLKALLIVVVALLLGTVHFSTAVLQVVEDDASDDRYGWALAHAGCTLLTAWLMMVGMGNFLGFALWTILESRRDDDAGVDAFHSTVVVNRLTGTGSSHSGTRHRLLAPLFVLLLAAEVVLTVTRGVNVHVSFDPSWRRHWTNYVTMSSTTVMLCLWSQWLVLLLHSSLPAGDLDGDAADERDATEDGPFDSGVDGDGNSAPLFPSTSIDDSASHGSDSSIEDRALTDFTVTAARRVSVWEHALGATVPEVPLTSLPIGSQSRTPQSRRSRAATTAVHGVGVTGDDASATARTRRRSSVWETALSAPRFSRAGAGGMTQYSRDDSFASIARSGTSLSGGRRHLVSLTEDSSDYADSDSDGAGEPGDTTVGAPIWRRSRSAPSVNPAGSDGAAASHATVTRGGGQDDATSDDAPAAIRLASESLKQRLEADARVSVVIHRAVLSAALIAVASAAFVRVLCDVWHGLRGVELFDRVGQRQEGPLEWHGTVQGFVLATDLWLSWAQVRLGLLVCVGTFAALVELARWRQESALSQIARLRWRYVRHAVQGSIAFGAFNHLRRNKRLGGRDAPGETVHEGVTGQEPVSRLKETSPAEEPPHHASTTPASMALETALPQPGSGGGLKESLLFTKMRFALVAVLLFDWALTAADPTVGWVPAMDLLQVKLLMLVVVAGLGRTALNVIVRYELSLPNGRGWLVELATRARFVQWRALAQDCTLSVAVGWVVTWFTTVGGSAAWPIVTSVLLWPRLQRHRRAAKRAQRKWCLAAQRRSSGVLQGAVTPQRRRHRRGDSAASVDSVDESTWLGARLPAFVSDSPQPALPGLSTPVHNKHDATRASVGGEREPVGATPSPTTSREAKRRRRESRRFRLWLRRVVLFLAAVMGVLAFVGKGQMQLGLYPTIEIMRLDSDGDARLLEFKESRLTLSDDVVVAAAPATGAAAHSRGARAIVDEEADEADCFMLDGVRTCRDRRVFTAGDDSHRVGTPETPRYGVCDNLWFGLDVVDYALLSKLAYFQPDGPEIPQLLATLFPRDSKGDTTSPEPVSMFELRQLPSDVTRVVPSFELYNEAANVSIIVVRGTDVMRADDILEDTLMWTEPVLMTALSVLPTVRIMSTQLTSLLFGDFFADLLTVFGLRSPDAVAYDSEQRELAEGTSPAPTGDKARDGDQHRHSKVYRGGRYYLPLVQHVLTMTGRNIVTTGHSLGGGLARVVAGFTNTTAIAFSPPGVLQTRRKFRLGNDYLHARRLYNRSVSIVPERDPVSMIDTPSGMVQYVMCRSASLISCHSHEMTTCELLHGCGDRRGRFTECVPAQNDLGTKVADWGRALRSMLRHNAVVISRELLRPLFGGDDEVGDDGGFASDGRGGGDDGEQSSGGTAEASGFRARKEASAGGMVAALASSVVLTGSVMLLVRRWKKIWAAARRIVHLVAVVSLFFGLLAAHRTSQTLELLWHRTHSGDVSGADMADAEATSPHDAEL